MSQGPLAPQETRPAETVKKSQNTVGYKSKQSYQVKVNCFTFLFQEETDLIPHLKVAIC